MANQTRVYICHTVFHLYVSLLKAYNEEALAYILIPDTLEHKLSHLWQDERIKVYSYPFTLIDEHWASYKKKHPFSVMAYPKALVSIVERDFDLSSFRNTFKHADFYVFNDAMPFVAYMMLKYRANHFTLVEEGEAIYTTLKKDLKYYIKRCSAYPLAFGNSKIINRVLVRFPERLSVSIRHKAEKFSLRTLESNLDEEQKENIIRFFDIHKADFKQTEKALLLITQPLSEDALVEESYKIALYQKMINAYGSDYQLYVKPHPRERTDYSQVFPHSLLVKNDFPIEALSLLGFRFKKVMTLFSTAIHAVDAEESLVLGLDYDLKVKQAWMKLMGVKKVNQ